MQSRRHSELRVSQALSRSGRARGSLPSTPSSNLYPALLLRFLLAKHSAYEIVELFGAEGMCYNDDNGSDDRVHVVYAMAGCFLPKPVACSNACAICRTLKSSLLRPTICTPTGSPSGVKPPGTEAAGLPVAEMYQQDFIQSM